MGIRLPNQPAIDQARARISEAEETYRQTIEAYREAGVSGQDLAREELRAARARDDATASSRAFLTQQGVTFQTVTSAPAEQPAAAPTESPTSAAAQPQPPTQPPTEPAAPAAPGSGEPAPVPAQSRAATAPEVQQGTQPGASAQNPSPSPAPRATAASPAGASAGNASTVAPSARGGSNAYLDRVLDPFRVRGISWDIQDNVLNDYDRYTYHFRLLMVNDQDSNDPLLGSKIRDGRIPTTTIAESGVTVGFNLVSVQIQDAVSPNFRTRNTVTTEIDMTITEAYGMTLIDRMFLASRQLGVRNWRLAPMVLELSFKFYNKEGIIVSSAADPIRKIYKLVLVDTESTLTEVGSTYRIKATASGSVGFKDYWFIIPQTYKVVAGQTAPSNNPAAQNNRRPNEPATAIIRASTGSVGEFFQRLGTQLTDFYIEQRNNVSGGTSTTPLIYYKFSVAPALAEKAINFTNQTNARRLGFSAPGSTNQEIIIGRGVSISDLIDDICASLVDTSFFTPPNSETTGTIRVPRVECQVNLIGYDVILNDYVRELNYVIGVLETLRPTPTVEHGRRFQTSIENQTSRTRYTASSNVLRKFYPFYYTGMNTEVIKLDLTFNQMHIISLPLHSGNTLPLARLGSSVNVDINQLQAEYRSLGQSISQQQQQYEQNQQLDQQLAQIGERRGRRGRQSAEPTALEREIVEEANRPLQRDYASPTNNEQTNIQRIVGERRAVIQGNQSLLSATISDNQARMGQLATQIQELRTGAIVFFQPNDPRASGPTSAEALQLYQQAQQARQQAAQRQSPRFAEDIPILSFNEPVDYAGLYSYAADPRDIANYLARSATTADNSNEVRGVYTTILAQLYDRQGQHLTEIEMDIRGDPYWLGLSNVERESELNDYINNRAAAQSGVTATFGRLVGREGADQNAAYANYYDRDASFLLLFRPGDQPSIETGLMEFKDSVFFNGIYHTIEVTHMFNNGQFTQKLRAVRDLININAVRDAPAANAGGTTASQNQPQAVPSAQPTTGADGSPATTSADGATAGATATTTPNASPANIEQSRQASVRTASQVAPGDISGVGDYVRGNSPEAIARRQADNAIIMRQFDRANNFTGSREGLADLTGEGRLRDPTDSIYQPRQVALPGRSVVNVTYNQANDTYDNTSAGPGQTVDYGAAELAAIRAGRTR